jgi:hypothetical protein
MDSKNLRGRDQGVISDGSNLVIRWAFHISKDIIAVYDFRERFFGPADANSFLSLSGFAFLFSREVILSHLFRIIGGIPLGDTSGSNGLIFNGGTLFSVKS